VRHQPGALPLLQHALLELWNKRDTRRLSVKAYQEIGKLEGALQRRADTTLEAFSERERELCRRTFLRLTQPGEGTEDTKRRVSMQELLSLSGKSTAEEAIIQKLTAASLLTTEGDLTQREAFVEVAHEALIRNWPQLRKWIDADRAGLRARARLTEAARDWKNAGRDPAYLYIGARLAVAKEWEASHSGELSEDETEFLVHSLEVQKQREASELEAAQAQKERSQFVEQQNLALRSMLYRELFLLTIRLKVTARTHDPSYSTFLKGSATQYQALTDLATVEALLKGEGRWHPQSAIHYQMTGPQSDYSEVYRFPCCGKFTLTFNDPPPQLSQEGCKTIAPLSPNPILIKTQDATWLRDQVFHEMEREDQRTQARYLHEFLNLLQEKIQSNEADSDVAEVGQQIISRLEPLVESTIANDDTHNHSWSCDEATKMYESLSEWKTVPVLRVRKP
jgi:hypothetical protein